MWYICVCLTGNIYNGSKLEYEIAQYENNERAKYYGGEIVIGPFPSEQSAKDYVVPLRQTFCKLQVS